MNNSNDISGRRKEFIITIVVIIRYLYYPWSSIVLFESELGLIMLCISNSRATTKNKKEYNWYVKKGKKLDLYKVFS